MVIQALAFYLFAAVLIVSAIMVITARNPVHSVLFLVLAFFNSAGLFVLLGAEFIGFLMVIVYVGAVAVLFLFVVMMLDIDFAHLRKGAMQFVPLGLAIGVLLMVELWVLFQTWSLTPAMQMVLDAPAPDATQISNTEALGAVLYTQYVYPFQIAGLILLVAMIGAIVLTHRVRPGVRRQSVASQHARRPDEAMEVQKIAPGTGA